MICYYLLDYSDIPSLILFPKHECAEKWSDMAGYNSPLNTLYKSNS